MRAAVLEQLFRLMAVGPDGDLTGTEAADAAYRHYMETTLEQGIDFFARVRRDREIDSLPGRRIGDDPATSEPLIRATAPPGFVAFPINGLRLGPVAIYLDASAGVDTLVRDAGRLYVELMRDQGTHPNATPAQRRALDDVLAALGLSRAADGSVDVSDIDHDRLAEAFMVAMTTGTLPPGMPAQAQGVLRGMMAWLGGMLATVPAAERPSAMQSLFDQLSGNQRRRLLAGWAVGQAAPLAAYGGASGPVVDTTVLADADRTAVVESEARLGLLLDRIAASGAGSLAEIDPDLWAEYGAAVAAHAELTHRLLLGSESVPALVASGNLVPSLSLPQLLSRMETVWSPEALQSLWDEARTDAAAGRNDLAAAHMVAYRQALANRHAAEARLNAGGITARRISEMDAVRGQMSGDLRRDLRPISGGYRIGGRSATGTAIRAYTR